MNLPAPFIEYTRSLLGDEAYQKLAQALSETPPVSIRFNPEKYNLPSVAYDKVPWSSEGVYLDERLTFTFDPLFHAGCYYVQEASSMFVEQVLRQYVSGAIKMLDLCAAPGGKSTHARSVLPQGSLLVSNELMRNRSQVLAENLTKWGYPEVVVTNNDPADFTSLTDFFDVILTDVPCSGEGMFRKDEVAIEEWSPENVEICWQRQRRIIADIWPSLKPGGLLIYSTCTYNTKENEENVQWISQTYDAEVLPVATQTDWNITGNLLAGADFPVYRFLPSRTRGEGFFLALLRKPADEDEVGQNYQAKSKKGRKKPDNKARKKAPIITKEQLKLASSWLNQVDSFSLQTDDTTVSAWPVRYADDIETLRDALRVVQAGVTVAEVKGRDLIPDHALAMSNLLADDVFAQQEVSYEQAIAYLRKEAICLPLEAPKGYILLTYRQKPLGFVKNIGNRANNLYPQEWRIRSGYLPEEIKTID